jgi:hypothetical protein
LQHIVAQRVDNDLQLGLLDLGDEGLKAARANEEESIISK